MAINLEVLDKGQAELIISEKIPVNLKILY